MNKEYSIDCYDQQGLSRRRLSCAADGRTSIAPDILGGKAYILGKEKVFEKRVLLKARDTLLSSCLEIITAIQI